MRHRVYGKHLGRNKNERTNLFKGLVQALFLHGTIEISSTRAKAIKGLVDKTINLAKAKRIDLLQTFVTDKSLRERLIKDIVPKLGNKTSGFTSTIRLGTRLGDQTTMVRMSLIGAEKLEPIKKESRIKNSAEGEARQRRQELRKEALKTEKETVHPKVLKKVNKMTSTKKKEKKVLDSRLQ